MASRTLEIKHRGRKVQVREGHDGSIEIRDGQYQQAYDGYWSDACHEALDYLLVQGGRMVGDYDRPNPTKTGRHGV